jgi:hypothetical protein
MSLLKIRQEIERLGGVFPIPKGEDFPVINDEELSCLEAKIGKALPQDYRDFLSVFAGCSFNQYILFKPLNNTAEYTHSDDSGYANPIFKGAQIAYFYGSDKGTHPISWACSSYLERIPSLCLPIASDGFGNQIILSLRDDSKGCIYWWDHENEWDAEDYEEENEGEEMPEQVKWQNMYLIAPSFVELFESFLVDTQA